MIFVVGTVCDGAWVERRGRMWTRYGVRIMYPGYGTFGRFLRLGE